MTQDRGEWRGIYTVLPDTPEFQDLGPEPQLLWFHLKLRLGAAGIDTLPAAEYVLSDATGIPPEGVRDGIAILSDRGWLRRERNVFWLRNALKFEPSRNLGNENHRKSIQSHIMGLPKLAVVNDFAAYYELDPPFPELIPSEGYRDGIPDNGRRKTEDGRRRTEDGENPPPVGDAEDIADPTGWQSEELGAWSGAQVFAAYIEYCQRRGWPPPPESQRGKLGAACKRLADANSPRQITMAMVGMGNLYPHSNGEVWDPMDLERKFTKAHAAATSSEDIQERAFAEAFLRRAG